MINLYQLLLLLLDKATALHIPSGSFQEQSLYEVAVGVLAVHQLVGSREVRHVCEQRGFVQGPAVTPARGLDYRRQIGLGDVEAGQPHHLDNHQSRDTGETCKRRHEWSGFTDVEAQKQVTKVIWQCPHRSHSP